MMAAERRSIDGSAMAHLIAVCHGASVKNGWWSDLETGTALDRNFGEMQILICTEIKEAHDAVVSECACDKPGLEDMPGEVEELADIVIRVCDLAGGYSFKYFAEMFDASSRVRITDPEYTYLSMFKLVGGSFDAARKAENIGGDSNVVAPLVMLVRLCERRAELAGWNILDAIARKLAYNAVRADHKPENRKLAGGKKL